MEGAGAAGTRAILLTDVVGSSELRSRLGDDRADLLRRAHDAMLGSAVTAHSGRVLRWTGDGLKASFATASAAVAAAIDMQRAVGRYSHRADAIAPFQIRIGISVGEVTAEDDDDHGVAVIEAARLEAMAAAGEILATDLVQRLGQRRGEAAYEEVGVRSLKGLDDPVVVVRVVDTAADAASRPLPKSLAIDGRFPLVGRGAEIEQALGRWREVRAGAAATVLAAGQPGIGKSRLIAQVAERTHTDGALVLAGTCDSELAVPYQPFAQAFTDAPSGDEQLAAALADGAGPLGALFPARRTSRLDDGPAARFELFEAVAALVARLADKHPVVLVLEDLQWAAPPTVQLLRHLVRSDRGTPILVLGTYRPEEVGPEHPLQELLHDLHALRSVSRIDLATLDQAEVTELIAARAPTAPKESVDTFARRMCVESGGSPFFVCELLDHLSTTGELEHLVVRGGGDRLPIPDSVRDVVGQRLVRLPDEAGRLLSAAAVIGLTFDLELLGAVVDQAPARLLDDLEQVEATALVHEVGVNRFGFAHAIVRSTLLDRTSATRRALTHRQVAEAIEALGRADHDELALHWELAGVADRANAARERAAQRDLEALAYESAAERFRASVDFHLANPTDDVRPLGWAWLGLGLARRAMVEVDCIDAIEEAGRLGRRLGDVDLVTDAAVASSWPGTYFVSAGETQTSLVELCEDALTLLGPDDPRRAMVLSAMAAHLTYDDDRERRVRLLREAEGIARQVGEPALIGGVLVAEHLALWDPTTFERRAEITREVGRMARASGAVDLEFFSGFLAAYGAAERCDVAEARRRLEALEDTVTASQNLYFGFMVDRLVVSLDLLTGRSDVQTTIDALAARYADTQADTEGTWSLQTGLLAFYRGTLGDLAPAMRTMVEESMVASRWLPPYAMALAAAGDHEGALAVLEQVEEPPLDYFWLTHVQGWGEVASQLGLADVAAPLYETLLPYRRRLGITATGSVCLGLVSVTLGHLAVTLGDHQSAIALLEEGLAQADTMGAVFESMKARRLLATALLASDAPPDEVAALLAVAGDTAASHGFEEEHGRIEALREQLAASRPAT